MRVADYVIDFIYKHNVKDIFTVSGGGIMYVDDAIAKHKKIKYICNHHEQASTLAADSYSRITQELGVSVVTSGPGATNSITGVLESWVDSTPCMIISGQSKKKETIKNSSLNIRQFGVFEVDITTMVKSITKYSIMITDPNSIRYHMEKAYYLAKSGRPGPVWVDIPLDVQGSLVDINNLRGFKPEEIKNKTNIQSIIDQFIELLANSKRPVIIAGNGIRISKSVKQFLTLVKLLNAPVVTTIMGTDLISEDNPNYVGRVGLRGTRSGNIAVQNSDLIISIGSRLSIPIIGYEYEKFASNAKKVVVDIDPEEHKKKTIKIDLFINLDVKDFIEETIKKISTKKLSFEKWNKKCKEIKKNFPVVLPEYLKIKSGINMYDFVDRLSNILNKDDVIITDAGSAFYVVRQAIKIKQGQRVLIAGGTGAMGVNLPSSIGASLALGKKRVICITGDGSIQTNIQEIQTIIYNELPIKIFVFNNEGYFSIKNTQDNYFGKNYMGVNDKTGLSLPNLSKISKGYDIKYFKITNNTSTNRTIHQALEYKGPVICEIICAKNQMIIPSVFTTQKKDGNLSSTGIENMYPFLSTKEKDQINKILEK